jgi:mRNA interferase MazF
MAGFMKGDVVIVPFPFADLSSSKRRPALVLAEAGEDDLVLSQITSQGIRDSHAVEISASDFGNGGLKVTSNVRPNKLFTAEAGIIAYKAGSLKSEKTADVVAKITRLLKDGE